METKDRQIKIKELNKTIGDMLFILRNHKNMICKMDKSTEIYCVLLDQNIEEKIKIRYEDIHLLMNLNSFFKYDSRFDKNIKIKVSELIQRIKASSQYEIEAESLFKNSDQKKFNKEIDETLSIFDAFSKPNERRYISIDEALEILKQKNINSLFDLTDDDIYYTISYDPKRSKEHNYIDKEKLFLVIQKVKLRKKSEELKKKKRRLWFFSRKRKQKKL